LPVAAVQGWSSICARSVAWTLQVESGIGTGELNVLGDSKEPDRDEVCIEGGRMPDALLAHEGEAGCVYEAERVVRILL